MKLLVLINILISVCISQKVDLGANFSVLGQPLSLRDSDDSDNSYLALGLSFYLDFDRYSLITSIEYAKNFEEELGIDDTISLPEEYIQSSSLTYSYKVYQESYAFNFGLNYINAVLHGKDKFRKENSFKTNSDLNLLISIPLGLPEIKSYDTIRIKTFGLQFGFAVKIIPQFELFYQFKSNKYFDQNTIGISTSLRRLF